MASAKEQATIQSCVPDKDVLSKLGQGTYGIVYKVRESGKEYALKTYVNGAFEPSNLIEIDTLVRMDHPNVVKTHKAYVNKQCQACLLLDLADSDLDKYMKSAPAKPGKVSAEQQRIMYGLACGLNYLHANFIVHKDLKPPNILMKGGVPKIADFGLATIRQSENLLMEGPIATIWWRPPEILVMDLAEDKEAPRTFTNKVDVWAMGLIFYQLIHGDRLLECDVSCSEDLLYQISRRVEPIPMSQIAVIDSKARMTPGLLTVKKGFNYSTVVSVLSSFHTPEGKEVANLSHTAKFESIPSPWRELIKKMLRTDPVDRISASQLVVEPAFAQVSKTVQCSKGVTDPRPFTINPSKFWMEKRQKTLKSLYKKVLSQKAAFFLTVDILDRFFTKVKKQESTIDLNRLAAGAWYIAASLYEQGEYLLYPSGPTHLDYSVICEIVTVLGFNLFRPTVDLHIPLDEATRTAIALCYTSHVSPDEVKECASSVKGNNREVAFKLNGFLKKYFAAPSTERADTVNQNMITNRLRGDDMKHVIDASSNPVKLRKLLAKFAEETRGLKSTKEYLKYAKGA